MRVYVIDENHHDAQILEGIIRRELGECLVELIRLNTWQQFKAKVNFVESRNLVFSSAIFLNEPNVENLIKELNQNSCPVIIYSNDEAQCIRAIKCGIFDFLLMPFSTIDICECLKRLEKKFNGILSASNVVLRDMKGSQVIPIQNIRFIEAHGAYSKVYCIDKELLVCRTLKSFEDEFNDPFIRIHRSFMVNIHCIDHFKLTELKLIDGKKLPISKMGRVKLMSKIPHFNFKETKF